MDRAWNRSRFAVDVIFSSSSAQVKLHFDFIDIFPALAQRGRFLGRGNGPFGSFPSGGRRVGADSPLGLSDFWPPELFNQLAP